MRSVDQEEGEVKEMAEGDPAVPQHAKKVTRTNESTEFAC